jgi:predicted DNA-binding protein (MmcQ/YjbR family)
MDVAELRAYLLNKPGAVADFPFGPQPLVLKVGGKMFALLSEREEPPQLSLKCDPYHAQLLREEYVAVRGGYHLNKRHWITVTLDDSVPLEEVRGLIDQSYALVVQKLNRAARRELEANDARA